MQTSDTFDNLPLELIRQVDSVARRAERDWREGESTALESYLEEVSTECQGVLLRELLSLETERRIENGQRPSLEELKERFPQHLSLISQVIDEYSLKGTSSSNSGKQRFPDLPGYSIQRVLGRGAMGVVYLARHERLQRLVALKVMAAGIDPQRAMTLIRSEAEVIARLRHPNIVQVYEIGQDQDEPFLSLEFVDGASLRDRLLGSSLSPREAAQLIEQLARAMNHAHVHGVVHRDLKPANILIPRSGNDGAKISDFGLAKVLDELNDHTRSGSVLGTPKYMAPEQAEGRTREVGPPADIYALGAILYELLTGHAPFESSSTLKLLKLISHEEASFKGENAKRVPADLQAICLKCLEKSPVKRYASAQELADDIRRYLDDYPIIARRPSRWDLATKFVRRNKVLAASTMVVIGTLLFASIGISIFALREAQARREAETLADRAVDARQRAEQLRKQERRKFYWANLLLAQQAGKTGRLEQMQQLLQQVEPTEPEDEDHRGFEWQYLKRLSRPPSTVIDNNSISAPAVYSPDGVCVATADTNGNLRIIRVADGALQKQWNATSVVMNLAYGLDGKQLATASRDGVVRLWDLETGTIVKELKGHAHPVRSLKFSRDFKRLYTADEVECVIAWDLSDDHILWKFERENLYVMGLSLHPDQQHLALGCGSGDVVILNPDNGEKIDGGHAHDFWLTALAYNPQGTRLATSCGDRTVKIWDTANFERPVHTLTHNDWVTDVTYSPDGNLMATCSRDASVRLWQADTGQQLLTLFGHANWVMGVNFSPDGKQVVTNSTDQTTRIWNPDVHWEVRSLAKHDSPITALTITKENVLIASDFKGTIHLFDLEGKRPPQAFPAHMGFISALALSTDDKVLASASHDGSIKLWSLSNHQLLTQLEGHVRYINAVAISSDDRLVASAGDDGTIRVWQRDTGKEIRRLQPDQSTQSTVAFSPDGRYLAHGGSQHIRIWDTRDWTEHLQLQGHTSAVMHIAYSADGTRLASCSMDQTIRQWDTRTGQQLNQLNGHTNLALGSAFSKDSRRLLTWGHDGAVRLWETSTGRELLTLSHHSDWVYAAAFNPSETKIATCSKDHSIKLIELE